jgi:high-affinity nickel-transport protein
VTRYERIRASLTPQEWGRAAVLAAAIVGLHVVGFVTLFAFVVPGHYGLGNGAVFGVGLGLTAYTLGMRHAFDADHIAAIDNTTRKLMSDGQRPLSVGFFFALGHSSIVFALAFLFAFGVKGLAGSVSDESSTLHTVTGVIGPTVSGLFLITLGLLNLMVLISILKVFRRMRTGDVDEAELEEHLNGHGLLVRFYARAMNRVRRPWHMYPVGLLFGLGFDTATEVALLAVAGSAAASGLPFWAILCLPVLFAAGMTLFDTLDGAFMSVAYGWAFAKPVRKVFYNITVTSLSVFVALVIGVVELVQVFVERFTLSGGLWDAVAAVDLNYVGYIIVGLFLATWVLSVAVWRFGRIEERWDAAAARAAIPEQP